MAIRESLPSAFEALERLRRTLANEHLFLFFDYDGTLTPIVERPEAAVLSAAMRTRIDGLAGRCFVSVISGRGLADLEERVGVEGIAYAGSHGFELVEPDGRKLENPEAQAALPALDAAEAELRRNVSSIDGAQLERKRFGLAVHYRRVAAASVPEMDRAVKRVLEASDGQLALKSGKKVWEFVPALDWDKGKALAWILEKSGGNTRSALPVYFGDDVTDEDAFRAVAEHGIGIAVGEGPEETAASHRLEDVEAVGRFLDALLSRDGQHAGADQ